MVGNFILIKCQCENSLWIYHNNYSDHKGKKREESGWTVILIFYCDARFQTGLLSD